MLEALLGKLVKEKNYRSKYNYLFLNLNFDAES